MAWDLAVFVRLLHIIGALLWVGGAAFHLLMVAPAAKAAGPGAGPFMRSVLQRGGFGPYYGAAALLTILTGAYLYVDYGYAQEPFGDGARAAVTVGMAAAVVAFVMALTLTMPLERRLKHLVASVPAGAPPAPEQAMQIQAIAAKLLPRGWVAFGLILTAVVGMAGRALFA
jgi:uncharacterized membrane protein